MNNLRAKWQEMQKVFGVMDDGSQKQELVFMRYIFYDYAKGLNLYTLSQIGEVLNRDHSSVIHGLKKYSDLVETKDKIFLRLIAKLGNSKTYQVVTCPVCKGQVYYSEYPCRTGYTIGMLINQKYICEYLSYIPAKCTCLETV